MQKNFSVSRIDAEATLPLRQAVLWPHHPLAASRVPGDETALHFGGCLGGVLICTASLFADDASVRLRKFATAQAHQGKGYGSEMMQFLLQEARRRGFQQFWMDARESALPFYLRFGFEPEGKMFLKRDTPYFRMARPL